MSTSGEKDNNLIESIQKLGFDASFKFFFGNAQQFGMNKGLLPASDCWFLRKMRLEPTLEVMARMVLLKECVRPLCHLVGYRTPRLV